MSTLLLRTRRALRSVGVPLAMLVGTAPLYAQQQPVPTAFLTPTFAAPGIFMMDHLGGLTLLLADIGRGQGAEILVADSPPNAQFLPTFTLPSDAATISDPRFERGAAQPTRVFFTEFDATLQRRVLRSAPIGGGTRTTHATLDAGNWALESINDVSTKFVFIERNDPLPSRAAILTLGGPFVDLGILTRNGTNPTVLFAKLSPNEQQIAFLALTTTLSGTQALLFKCSTTVPANFVIAAGAQIRSQIHWLDDQFVACVAEAGPPPAPDQIVRIDINNGFVHLLTQVAEGQIAGGLGMSEDRQWLSATIRHTLRDTAAQPQTPSQGSEVTPLVMRVKTGDTFNPGGAYIVVGDYRSPSPPTSLTNWFESFPPDVRSPVPGAAARLQFLGRRQLTDPLSFFSFDVIDEINVTPRATPGAPVLFNSIAPSMGVALVVFASLGHEPTPIRQRFTAPQPIPGVLNLRLIHSEVQLFTGLPTGNVVSVPLTLPSNPLLAGAVFHLQGIWLNNDGSFHLTNVSELPIF